VSPEEPRRPFEKETPQCEPTGGNQADRNNLEHPEGQNQGVAQGVQAHAALLFDEPGRVVELRALGVQGVRGGVVSGYFDDPEKLTAAARRLDGRAKGIYVTLNPVRPELLARASNRTIDSPASTTGDAEITRRLRLLIDIDPARPSGISATEEERQAAFAVAREVLAYLEAMGFPEPVKADSGNGGHLVYAIDLPVNDDGLVQRVLAALAFKFDTATARIDQSVHNAARICKLYGTLACKGDSTQERPHRRSRLIGAGGARSSAAGAAGAGRRTGAAREGDAESTRRARWRLRHRQIHRGARARGGPYRPLEGRATLGSGRVPVRLQPHGPRRLRDPVRQRRHRRGLSPQRVHREGLARASRRS
jgi:hypothetical protein